jgi:cysteinyl-tRNA synthetase
MHLYNSLTDTTEETRPLDGDRYRVYSCGPTVYDHAHIGNLSAYIFADTLRRVLTLDGPQPLHVMNYTDVDDKTIRRSRETYPEAAPREALRQLTDEYIKLFRDDMAAVGNDLEALQFVRATDSIPGMIELITDLHEAGFAYLADDGVYFSIEKYRASGKTYGQLVKLTTENTSSARINNDEYDKESVHDFALWKTAKPGEPSWPFMLDGTDIAGRPGWHIECSVMSKVGLGQPFDIHTGGIDLQFPHHENEIAQSTALTEDPRMAAVFAHNEHILVEGRKMAKSAQNFFTLQDIIAKEFDPLAFRLLVLQSHYRNPVNFSWDSLEAAQNRLQSLRAYADLRFQTAAQTSSVPIADIKQALQDDLATPEALRLISAAIDNAEGADTELLTLIDATLGLQLLDSKDISDDQRQLITERETARAAKDWSTSDRLRDSLLEQGVAIRDTPHGTIWFRQ